MLHRPYTLGSLFDGIGGRPLAAVRSGILPLWASEIDAFPQSVTAVRFEKMEQLGDITKIDGTKIAPVDIICAGSPCQDLSIAGNREGLQGERSGLFACAIEIVRAMRKATGGLYPRYFVWENVPGAFSSNKRQDFRAVLEEVTETRIPMPNSGRWANAGVVRTGTGETAWRVLDAQFWGVPQHRERIFLIRDFAGYSAGKILFEREGLHRNSPAGGKEKQDFTRRTEISLGTTVFKERAGKPGGGKGILISNNDKAYTLTQNNDNNICYDMCHPIDVLRKHEKTAPALCSRMGTGGNNVPLIKRAFCLAGNTIDRKLENGGNGKGVKKELSYTLNTIDRHAVLAIGNGQADTTKVSTIVPTLSLMHDQQGVLIDDPHLLSGKRVTGSILANMGNRKAIRRLTPLECERLQGLPDNWTLIDAKCCSDSARYKAIGNGMAQPCADFIIKGIYLELEESKMTELEIERCIAATSELRGILERAPKSPERERAIEKCTNDISAFSLAVKVLQEDKRPKKEKAVEELPEVKQTKRPDPPAKAVESDDDDDDLI